MCINYLVTRYEYRKGQSLRSQVLMTNFINMKSDLYSSLLTIIRLAAIKLGFSVFTPISSLNIPFMIFKAGCVIVKENSRSL
jgi:divalent metal cation (Fe/Co/Zn/Cd) transporter